MGIQTQRINIGTSPDAGNGDTVRAAFSKLNSNLDEYDAFLSNSIDTFKADVTGQLLTDNITDAIFKSTVTAQEEALRGRVDALLGTSGTPEEARSLLGLGGTPLSYVNRGNWATSTAYAINDIVLKDGTWYACPLAHTSGTFATDLAANKWLVHQGLTAELLAASGGSSLIGYSAVGSSLLGSSVWVESWGNDTTAVVGRRERPFATINAALDALPATGGSIYLGVGRFAPLNGVRSTPNKMKDNVRFFGSGMGDYSSDSTTIVGGTIIDGPIIIENSGVKFYNLGVDSGTAVCATRYSGAPQEGLCWVNNGFVMNKPPLPGCGAHNVISLCQSSVAAMHSFLFENLIDVQVSNIRSRYGIHGIVFKGYGGTATNLIASGHNNNAVIIRSNYEANVAQMFMLSNLYMHCVAENDTRGIALAQSGTVGDIDGITISNVLAVKLAEFELALTSGNPYKIRNLRIENFNAINAAGNKIEPRIVTNRDTVVQETVWVNGANMGTFPDGEFHYNKVIRSYDNPVDGANPAFSGLGFALDFEDNNNPVVLGGIAAHLKYATGTSDVLVSIYTRKSGGDHKEQFTVDENGTSCAVSEPIIDSELCYNILSKPKTAYNGDRQGGIGFYHEYDSDGNGVVLAGIVAGKENSTSGDFAGFLALCTRANGGNHIQHVKVHSNGKVTIGNVATLEADAILQLAGAFRCLQAMVVKADGSNVLGTGPNLCLVESSTTRQWIIQMNASRGLDFNHYNGTAWVKPFTVDAAGNIVASGSVTGAHVIQNAAPASNAGGTPGNITFDANYMYVCVAASGANSWKRVALSTY